MAKITTSAYNMKKVFKIFKKNFPILSIARFCQIKWWIYRHLSIIAKLKKKRKKKKKNWIQYLVWGYNVGNVTWDLGEHRLLLVPSPETLVCYFPTRARFGVVCLFCFVLLRGGCFGSVHRRRFSFHVCVCLKVSFLHFRRPFFPCCTCQFLLDYCTAVSAHEMFFCFSYDWWDKSLIVCNCCCC